MKRLAAVLAALAVLGCGGSTSEPAAAGTTGPTGPTGPTGEWTGGPAGAPSALPFSVSLTRGAELRDERGVLQGYYWDLTFSGPWPGWYLLGQYSGPQAICYEGGGMAPAPGGGAAIPMFTFACPAGGCTHSVRRLLMCPCGDGRPPLVVNAPTGATTDAAHPDLTAFAYINGNACP